jgi:hypothetical protein
MRIGLVQIVVEMDFNRESKYIYYIIEVGRDYG